MNRIIKTLLGQAFSTLDPAYRLRRFDRGLSEGRECKEMARRGGIKLVRGQCCYVFVSVEVAIT